MKKSIREKLDKIIKDDECLLHTKDLDEIISNNINNKKTIIEILKYLYDSKDLYGLYMALDNKLLKSSAYDDLKAEYIEYMIGETNSYWPEFIATSISDDSKKIEILMNNADKEFTYEEYKQHFIIYIINHLKVELLKPLLFEKYKKELDYTQAFEDYIINIKNRELKIREYNKYEKDYPECDKLKIASSFDNDRDRMDFISYYVEVDLEVSKDGNYAKYLKSLDKDENKLAMIREYKDILGYKSIPIEPNTFKSVKNLTKAIKYYGDYFDFGDFFDYITYDRCHFSDNQYTSVLNAVYKYASSRNIVEIIIRINDDKKKEELFDKYIDYIDPWDYRSVIIYLDDKNKKDFILRHNHKIDSYVFKNLTNLSVIDAEWLSYHVELLTPSSLSFVIGELKEDYENGMIKKLLTSHAFSFNEKRKVYNALLLSGVITPNEFFKDNKILDIYSEEEINNMKEAYKNNKDIFKTCSLSIFKIPFIMKDKYLFNKISTSDKLGQLLDELYYNYYGRLELFTELVRYPLCWNINPDGFIFELLEGMTDPRNTILDNIDPDNITHDDKLNILFYILHGHELKNVKVRMDNYDDVKTYRERMNDRLNDLFNNTKDLDEKKKYLLYRDYGLTYFKHNRNICVDEELFDEYTLETINRMWNDKKFDPSEENIAFYYDNDRIESEYAIETLHTPCDREFDIDITYNDTVVPLARLPKQFNLLVSNINSKSNNGMNKVIDFRKRFDSQNKNIINCEYISELNMHQPSSPGNVLVGFNNVNPRSVIYKSSLKTDYLQYKDVLSESENFYDEEDYINKDKDCKNQFVLNKIGFTDKPYEYEDIKPSYVLSYSSDNDELFKKSLMAASQFGVPIYRIDEDDVAAYLYDKIERYKSNMFGPKYEYYFIAQFREYVNIYAHIYQGNTFSANGTSLKYIFDIEDFKKTVRDFIEGLKGEETWVDYLRRVADVLEDEDGALRDDILQEFINDINNYINDTAVVENLGMKK